MKNAMDQGRAVKEQLAQLHRYPPPHSTYVTDGASAQHCQHAVHIVHPFAEKAQCFGVLLRFRVPWTGYKMVDS